MVKIGISLAIVGIIAIVIRKSAKSKIGRFLLSVFGSLFTLIGVLILVGGLRGGTLAALQPYSNMPTGWNNPDKIFNYFCTDRSEGTVIALGTADGSNDFPPRDTLIIMKNKDTNNYVFNVNFSGVTKPAYILKRITDYNGNDESYALDAMVIEGQKGAGQSEVLGSNVNLNWVEGKGYTYHQSGTDNSDN